MNLHRPTIRIAPFLAVPVLVLAALSGFSQLGEELSDNIPLPEHPRPDYRRPDWLNLNGSWHFRFDGEDRGLAERWYQRPDFDRTILVPFPWGSPLSGLRDEAEIGWYARPVKVPSDWQGKRIFLIVGASDWRTTAWVDGAELGSHEGGYVPFEFELTSAIRFGSDQQLVLRVDDRARRFKLEGKQGYGNARGVWQTVYLEARGSAPAQHVHVFPEPESQSARVRIRLLEPAPTELACDLTVAGVGESRVSIPAGGREAETIVSIPEPRLWTLDDPHLYDLKATLTGDGLVPDEVSTYFGMRTIGVANLPGTDIPYVSLNGKPVYLQLTLDQAYHPEGFYTFPSDDFVRDEILRSLKIGLNGMRVHVKIPIPRKLYWADRLGLLIMADVPNSWGEPTPEMQADTTYALESMIARDFNHPSVFSWVIFNETWGLRTGDEGYKPETQAWVKSMYEKAKQLDPTRLVEDNSPHRFDHVATDLNTWHSYQPGYGWPELLEQVNRDTYPGSPWNFVEGAVQGNQPMFNSECGNVWGYEGSAGDVDWSWDYHLMINEFRRWPKIAGWLYTEHHDVINEWNGYYRYDRSEKDTGLSDLVPDMTLNDLHSPVYLVPGRELCTSAEPGAEMRVPLHLSVHDLPGGARRATLRAILHGWDELGRPRHFWSADRPVDLDPWTSEALEDLVVPMPQARSLVVLALTVEDPLGSVLHRNFTTFLVGENTPADRHEVTSLDGKSAHLLRFAPGSFSRAAWEDGFQSEVLDGLKVSGARHGFFEYQLDLPASVDLAATEGGFVLAELSARQVLGRDVPEGEMRGDYMRGEGTHDPSRNPNAYPMTDTRKAPSLVRVSVNGTSIGSVYLPDDPADHRGILSWFSQLRDRRLREAGTYGYLVNLPIPRNVLAQLASEGTRTLVIRFEVDDSLPGGLAIYGEHFGRYPFDPTVGLLTR